MAWRLTRSAYETGKGAKNRARLRRLVSREPPGILAYAGAEPVGWCAVAAREAYSFLGRSRVLAPIDDTPVWSISCLLVKRDFRRQGISARLLRAAADFACERGSTVIEGYPVDPEAEALPDAFAWTGLVPAFRAAGFREVARRSPTRPIMRRGQGRARPR